MMLQQLQRNKLLQLRLRLWMPLRLCLRLHLRLPGNTLLQLGLWLRLQMLLRLLLRPPVRDWGNRRHALQRLQRPNLHLLQHDAMCWGGCQRPARKRHRCRRLRRRGRLHEEAAWRGRRGALLGRRSVHTGWPALL